MAKKNVSSKVAILLDGDTLTSLDHEINRIKAENPGVGPTRASVGRSLIKQGLLRKPSGRQERLNASAALTHEAGQLKSKALECRSNDNLEPARVAFLTAAIRELEVLVVLRSPSESVICSTLVEVIGLLKAGTNYNILPNIPKR